MFQTWSAVAGSAWLIVASVQAPFIHVHPDDPDHHHASGLSHFHLPSRASHESEIESSEEDEVTLWLDWAPVSAQPLIVPDNDSTAFTLVAPRGSEAERVAEFRPCSHDPPVLGTLPPRAPPL